MFCFTIIEQNLRHGRGREEDMLDSYFPFDPFLLKKSRKWIDECYVVWTPVPGLDEEDDSDSDSDSDAEDEDEAEELDSEDEDESDGEQTP